MCTTPGRVAAFASDGRSGVLLRPVPARRHVSLQRVALLLAIAVAAAPALGPSACLAAADPSAPATPASRALAERKLAAEVAKLEHENAVADGFSGLMARYAALLTALVAAGGLAATIFRQTSELRAQRLHEARERENEQAAREHEREKDLADRERELEYRLAEQERRLEDRFAAILGEMGSVSPAIQAGAAASLVTYLEPGRERFHHQTRLAVLTNLKLELAEPIRKLLALVYGLSLESGAPVDRYERDLSHAKLAETSLCDVNLREADLAHADLTNTVLLGSNLYRAKGIEVVLEGARLGAGPARAASLIEVRFRRAQCRGADFSGVCLVNAHLQEADLREARFYGASLQAAHLEGADLRGARFQQADIADTYFRGAILDDDALYTLVRARNREKAHFDPAAQAVLDAY